MIAVGEGTGDEVSVRYSVGVGVTVWLSVGGRNVAVGEAVDNIVAVIVAVVVNVAVFVNKVVPLLYSICSKGAPAASPSKAFAIRFPVLPVMITTNEFPDTQPGWLTIS